MRLWTLDPRYLDTAGLVAAWREGLLAQKVLMGGTRGYVRHPQLERFKANPDPINAIRCYLLCLHKEAVTRRYRFDSARVGPCDEEALATMPVSRGQLLYELQLLLSKLRLRDSRGYERLLQVTEPRAAPVFAIREGPIEDWERPMAMVAAAAARASRDISSATRP